jgi:hypothetical protein
MVELILTPNLVPAMACCTRTVCTQQGPGMYVRARLTNGFPSCAFTQRKLPA